MSELVILDTETKNVQKVSFVEDTDLYQELKITSQKFLEVNNFKFDGEPKINKFSNREFISYIEKKTEKERRGSIRYIRRRFQKAARGGRKRAEFGSHNRAKGKRTKNVQYFRRQGRRKARCIERRRGQGRGW